MEELILAFFPYATVYRGTKRPGYNTELPTQCGRCANQCQSIKGAGVLECPFGVNFTWSGDLLVFGFLTPGSGAESKQKKCARRQSPRSQTRLTDLQKAIDLFSHAKSSITGDIEDAKREVVEEYKRKKEYQPDLLESLKPELQRQLTFLHDYKQFVARVKQNINVILETRYVGGTLDEKLRRSTKAEGAIYWSTEIMEEKLNFVFLLTQPDQLFSRETKMFRIHGAVLKYVRIYQAAYDEKGVRLEFTGESIGEIRANPRPFGAIPHALIDNALKYSVRGSKVRIHFEETSGDIELSVTSFGPRIHQEEKQAIFEMLFRGAEAVKHEREGSGFGLYLAQTVAQQMGTRIQVEQATAHSDFGYETRFSVRFPRAR